MLDTNVWLDWLVFDDPGVEPIRHAVASQALVVLATGQTRAELEDVLGRPQIIAWGRDRQQLMLQFDGVVTLLPAAPACPHRCSDPDDQKFIDLAVASGARWLVTRDKALLALARHARRDHGLSVVRPADFAAEL